MKVALVPAVLAFAAFLQPLSADPPESHFEFTGGVPDKLVFTTEPEYYYEVKSTDDLTQPFDQVDHFPQMHDGGTLEHVIAPDVRQFFIIEYNVAPDPSGLAWIPGGSFQMGDSLGEGDSDELPVHTVTVDGFYMQRAEVTKAEWDTVTSWAQSNGYDITPLDGFGKGPDHPVHYVTWYECVKYANARSEMEGLSPCYRVGGGVYRTGNSTPDVNYSASGYRLPTEAEWEYAARGGLSGQRFPWGATIDHDRANYRANGSYYSYDVSPYTSDSYHPDWYDGDTPHTSLAGTFAPNGYGLYDMTGNLWEWCGDWWSSTYYGSSPSNNPTGPASGLGRVCRGGSWADHANDCRAADRYGNYPHYFEPGIGFRLVRRDPSGFAWIPGGSFQMGDSLGDGFSDELPVHTVTVDGFYMQRTEVTNDEMVAVLNWAYAQGKLVVTTATVRNAQGNQQELLDLDDSDCRISWNGSQFVMKSAKGSGYPCVEVTWYGSVAYANYRSEMDGLTPCYDLTDWSCNFSASGYRLPTEAEWEYAARGGLSGQRFPWGATITHSDANYYSSSSYGYDVSPTRGYHPDWYDVWPYTSPAGTFAPNGYGLYDMAGNLWELCGDWYSSSYYASSPSNNPTGPNSGPYRVIRGGSWGNYASNCRVAYRNNYNPAVSGPVIGFRLLRR